MAERTRLSLKSFLETFKETLRAHIIDAYPPIYTPADRPRFADRLGALKRTLYPAQADAAAALALGLRKEKSAFLVGETGVGKTIMGGAIAHLLDAMEVLVVCPPHMVKKWEREVKRTLPSCEVVHLKSIADVSRALWRPLLAPRWYIVNRERSKLSYRWMPAAIRRRVGRDTLILVCPSCFNEIRDAEGVPILRSELARRKEFCSVCKSPLWQADRRGVRRYALADYIKKKMNRKLDLLILDEAHEFKARDSAQGIASAALKQACRRSVALTGTLYGGYSTSIFYLIYRLTNRLRKEYQYADQMRWAAQYGILERITREGSNERLEDGSMSRRRGTSTRIVERPGVSPAILAHLLPITVFVRLSSLGITLPPFEEKVITCKMERDQAAAYKKLQKRLSDVIRPQLALGNKSLLGAYLQALLCYPDQPFRPERISDPKDGKIIAEGAILPEERLYPKERELLRLIEEEMKENRRVLLYISHTQKRDLTPRLQRLLEAAGVRATVLRSEGVKAENREEWIEKEVRAGVQVLITHPKLVQTGLDLYDFPTLIFLEPETSVYTIRQASRRSWRPRQTQTVRCYYLAYEKTLQEQALALIAAKVRSALLVEGELIDSGLTSYKENDFFLRLARALLGEEETIDQGALTNGIARPSDIEGEMDRAILPNDFPDEGIDPISQESSAGQENPSLDAEIRIEVETSKTEREMMSESPEQMALF